MYKLIVLLVTAAMVLGAPKGHSKNIFIPRLDDRITGGHDVDIKDYPYQISLQYRGKKFCGGTIISSKFVVTAAQCNHGVDANDLSIHAGSSILDSGGVEIQVAKIHLHPKFNYFTADYDISVLELKKELTFGPGIGAVDLPSLNENVATGTNAVTSGWGYLYENGLAPHQLQAVEVPIVDFKECKKAYASINPVTDRMICAGLKEGGKGACNGDAGGPLVVGKKLIGVISWGSGCARPNRPGVYSSVPKLRKHILDVTGL